MSITVAERRLRDAHKVLAVLEGAGHEARLAGGSVRDRLLGQAPLDYDVATTALPGAVQAAARSKPPGVAALERRATMAWWTMSGAASAVWHADSEGYSMSIGRSGAPCALARTVLALIGVSVGVGCSPPPHPTPDALADSGLEMDTPVDTDVGVDSVDSDSLAESDANTGDTAAADEGPESGADSESLACQRNDECVGLALLPCTVGVCDNHRCAKQFVSVVCDDRDPCTTDEECVQGA